MWNRVKEPGLRYVQNVEGFAGVLGSLGFLLWTMGSQAMLVNMRSAFWGESWAAVWRTELATKTVVVIDDFSPCKLCSLENPTHPQHTLQSVEKGVLQAARKRRSFLKRQRSRVS